MPSVDIPGGVHIIEGNDEVRAKKCHIKIGEILKLYRCVMLPMLSLSPEGIQGGVKIVAIPDEPKKKAVKP